MLYEPERLKLAMDLFQKGGQDERAVLTGAALSGAFYSVALVQNQFFRCPYCRTGSLPNWLHVAWECPGIGRPQCRPYDIVQARLGWPHPALSKPQNTEVLAHLSRVRKLTRNRCLPRGVSTKVLGLKGGLSKGGVILASQGC